MSTTEPYANGAIPYVRQPRRNRRPTRPLVYNPAADQRAQRLAAMAKTEEEHRKWRSRGAARINFQEPKLEDYLPEHLKAERPPEFEPVLERDDETLEDDDAPHLATVPPGDDDDTSVPGLGAKPPGKPSKAKSRKASDDTIPEIEIP